MVELHVTFADSASAEALAREAVQARLAACANLVAGVRSLYWWDGQVEDETEVLAIFKTSAGAAEALMAFIEQRHPYDTPAIIRHDGVSANRGYEDWIAAETENPTP